MAGSTIGAKLAIVCVIFGVAVHTGGWGTFVSAPRMTVATFKVVMARHQREEVMLYRTFREGNIQRIIQTVSLARVVTV